MKIKVSQPRIIEVDVEFPIYRKHELEYSTFYTMTTLLSEGNFYVLELHKDESGWSVEERIYGSLDCRSGEDYVLGKGIYSCSALEFKRAWSDFQDFVAGITHKNSTELT